MPRNIQFASDRVEETRHEAEIHVVNTTTTDHGPNVQIDAPYQARDDIKALNWEDTFRSWNGGFWTIDFPALLESVEHLTSEGYTITVPQAVLRHYKERYGELVSHADNESDDDELVAEIETSTLVTIEHGDSYLNLRPTDGEGYLCVQTLEIPDFYLTSARWSLASESIRYDPANNNYRLVASDDKGDERILAQIPAGLVEEDDVATDGDSSEIRCDGGTEEKSPEERVERMPDVNPEDKPTTKYMNADTCPFCAKTVEIHAVHAAYPDTGNLIGQFVTACSEERSPMQFDGVDEQYEQRKIVTCPYCDEEIAICLIRESDPDWTGGRIGYGLAKPNLRETDGFEFAVDEVVSTAQYCTPAQTLYYWVMNKTDRWDTKKAWAEHQGKKRSTISRPANEAEDELPETLLPSDDDFGVQRDRPIRYDDGILTADDVREINDDEAVYILDEQEEGIICAFFPDEETDWIWWVSPSGRSSRYTDEQARVVVAHSPTQVGDRDTIFQRWTDPTKTEE